MNANVKQNGAGNIPAVGKKLEVWKGKAKHTVGGLTRKDLMQTKRGKIVSKKQHAHGLKMIKSLRKLGYVAKKGEPFKLFTKKHGKPHRGGGKFW
jgi:hypothetical protein